MAEIARREGVDDHYFASAESFLSALGTRGDLLSGSAWIFRGQANADWALQSTAVRDAQAFMKYGLRHQAGRVGEASWSTRVDLLKELLERFRVGLDRSGLVIPTPSPRVDGPQYGLITSMAEPHRDAFPLMALAQHHGLPTLLLDWSRRPSVAAYFAAVEAADTERLPKGTAHLAVWALERTSRCDDPSRSLFYEAPGGTNPNLHAQEGLFTFFVEENDPSLEEYLCRVRERRKAPWKLLRLVLAVSEAPLLLKLLADDGITGASLFPGADGVVRAMREEVLWGSTKGSAN